MDGNCYACEALATTREHVPPRAFFPSGFRENLWTVPSCALHNLDNSLDVEYVRNVICVQRGTNAVAQAAFETAKRAWERSPALFNRTFNEVREVIIEGEAAGVFPFDLARIKTVVSAMCRALAYRDFGRGYEGDWRVFCASLRSEQASPEWDRFRAMLSDSQFTTVTTPQPQVFTYGKLALDIAFAYRLVFYDAFTVFSWPVINYAQHGA